MEAQRKTIFNPRAAPFRPAPRVPERSLPDAMDIDVRPPSTPVAEVLVPCAEPAAMDRPQEEIPLQGEVAVAPSDPDAVDHRARSEGHPMPSGELAQAELAAATEDEYSLCQGMELLGIDGKSRPAKDVIAQLAQFVKGRVTMYPEHYVYPLDKSHKTGFKEEERVFYLFKGMQNHPLLADGLFVIQGRHITACRESRWLARGEFDLVVAHPRYGLCVVDVKAKHPSVVNVDKVTDKAHWLKGLVERRLPKGDEIPVISAILFTMNIESECEHKPVGSSRFGFRDDARDEHKLAQWLLGLYESFAASRLTERNGTFKEAAEVLIPLAFFVATEVTLTAENRARALCLTKEQAEVIARSSGRAAYIGGPAGSGKTVVAKYMYQRRKETGQVCYLCHSTKFRDRMRKEQEWSKESGHWILTHEELCDTLLTHQGQELPLSPEEKLAQLCKANIRPWKHHIIIDEGQLVPPELLNFIEKVYDTKGEAEAARLKKRRKEEIEKVKAKFDAKEEQEKARIKEEKESRIKAAKEEASQQIKAAKATGEPIKTASLKEEACARLKAAKAEVRKEAERATKALAAVRALKKEAIDGIKNREDDHNELDNDKEEDEETRTFACFFDDLQMSKSKATGLNRRPGVQRLSHVIRCAKGVHGLLAHSYAESEKSVNKIQLHKELAELDLIHPVHIPVDDRTKTTPLVTSICAQLRKWNKVAKLAYKDMAVLYPGDEANRLYTIVTSHIASLDVEVCSIEEFTGLGSLAVVLVLPLPVAKPGLDDYPAQRLQAKLLYRGQSRAGTHLAIACSNEEWNRMNHRDRLYPAVGRNIRAQKRAGAEPKSKDQPQRKERRIEKEDDKIGADKENENPAAAPRRHVQGQA